MITWPSSTVRVLLRPSRSKPPTWRREGCGMIESTIEYVTATVGEQLFGLPIARAQDVFAVDRLTRVPLAAPEIAGVLNLRGRIVTAIDLRRRLGLAPAADNRKRMAIGI